MNFIDKMVERFIKLNRRMKRWQRVVSVMAAVVVFATTYALILPAITLDTDTATTQAGIEVAASENESDEAGTVFESVEEELIEEKEPVTEVEEESVTEVEENLEEAAAEENSGSESGSQGAEETQSEVVDDNDADADEGEQTVVLTTEEVAAYATTEEAIAAVTGQTAEEVKLISEDTQLTYEGSDYIVYADFDESAKFPEGVQLRVKEITKESDPEAYEVYYQKAFSEMQGKYDENTTLSFAKFYDIAFVYKDVEIEPNANVSIRIEYKQAVEIEKDTAVDTIHFDKNDEEKAEVISSDTKGSEKEVEAVEFESDRFSVYGIVGTETITVPFVAGDGSTYEVTVTFDKETGIPENAQLLVSEVTENSSKYGGYVDQAAKAIDTRTIDLQYVKLLDISIVDKDGNKVELNKPVDVQIKLLDKEQAEETTQVVHFEGTDENPVVMESNVEGDKIAFSTDGFSVYAVVDPGEGGDEARIALNFHKGDGTIVTMYVKNNDVLLGDGTRTDGESYIEDIVYDPGAYIPDGYLFLGWTEEENYTKDSERKTIEDIRTEVAALADNDSIREGDRKDYYAAVYKVVNVAYLGDGGVSLGTDSFLRTPNDPASFSYTVNMAYTADSTHNFEGWLVKEGGSNIANHSEGKVYKNETEITISGSVTFSVDAPEGQWLVFHENKGTYIPPQFVKSGEVTEEPTAEMKRLGYTFDGWYTKDGTDDDWGSRFTFGETITDRTHVYAKWSTVPTANYVVLIWKQNVNDAKNAADSAKTYDFAESITLSGDVNTIINTVTAQGTGNNRYARVDGTNKQYAGFHLNRFDTNVTIAPEGSTVLNVYYDRNLVTLTFQYRNNGQWATQATMTGLYGSTLASNGYTWPTNRWWYDSYQQNWQGGYSGAGTRTTFLDAFKLSNDASEHTYYGFTGNGNRTVYFYKKNADNNNYTLTNEVSITGGNNATFYISDKYNGYKAVSYSRNNTAWTSLGNKDSDGYYASVAVGYQDLYIRYDPLLYNILYMDGVYVDGDGNPVSGYESQGELNHVNDIPFESSVASYNKGGANYYEPTAKYNGFVFDGWYIDDACTQAYTFTNMPEGITVYAKWVQVQYRVFLHPEAGTDTSLDWGSNDQAMNFRVSYLGKVNSPFGTRNEYEFVGWFTESGAPFNDETLLTDTNTVPYNKAIDMTDPMDKWGNLGNNPYNSDAVGYHGGDRFWITRKLDLYGKWRRVIDGAEGIGIVYDLNGGTGTVTDTTLYKDSASAVAQNAPTAPATKQFDHWVVQTWNNTTKRYEDTSVVVYPGDNFDVLKNDSKVEVTEWKSAKDSTATTQAQSPAAVYSGADNITGPTGYPYISKATYTIQLKAVYIDAGEHTPTHIDWYENYDDNTMVHSDSSLHINQAVEIEPALERPGYTFLGWARVPTTQSGSDAGSAVVLDLDENDVYLKYNEVSGGDPYWTVNVNGAERTVTHVAADEIIPYHDMYAVWEPKTYTVTVIKNVDGIEGDASKPFTFTPDIGGVAGEDFTLTGTSGSNSKVVSEEVPYGATLKITEAATDDFTATATYSVTNADAEADNVTDQSYTNGAELVIKGDTVITFTNTRSQQHLHIKKVGNDAADGLGGAEFSLGSYNTLVSDSEAETLGNVYYTEDNEKVYDLILPVSDTAYTLSETTAPAYYTGIDDVPVTVSKGNVIIGNVSGAEISGPVNGVYTITVTNTRKTATVILTKNVEGLDSDKNTEFEFTISGIGSENITKNLVGNTESEDHTVSYTGVPYGASITIAETQNSEFDSSYKLNDGEADKGNTATFTVSDETVVDGVAAVTFTNARNKQALQVLKVDEGTNPLANAVFSLYTKEEYDKGTSGTPEQTGLTSNGQGEIQIGSVATDTYYLVETTAPSGYNLLDKPVIITIDSNRVYATLGSDSAAENVAELITPETGSPYWLITVHNNHGVELPHAGGPGTLLYTLSGIALMLGAALMYGFRMRRRERRLN